MSKKILKFEANNKDVRLIAANTVTIVLQRYISEYQEAVVEMNECLGSGDRIEILEKLQKVIDVSAAFVLDLENTSDLISEIEDVIEPTVGDED